MNKIIRTALCLLCALTLLLPLCLGCAKQPKKFTDQSFEWFDSYHTLTAYAETQEEFDRYASLCRSVLQEYHGLLDIYHAYDGTVNLKSINESGGAVLSVSSALLEFLCFSREIYALTDGYTNIAMGGVIDLWHQAAEQASNGETPALPDAQALSEALRHTDLSALQISEEAGTVALSDPVTSLNAGAVGKGYAAQKAAEALYAAGCTSFLLDVGGNVLAYGEKPDGELWRVGIRTPEGHAGYPSAVTLSDASLVTSGSYERYFEVNGVRYHHILHPQTGYPTQDFVSVSVLCRDSALADALSTALFSMTLGDGMALLDTLDGVEAVWLLSDGQTICSQGFEALAKGGAS